MRLLIDGLYFSAHAVKRVDVGGAVETVAEMPHQPVGLGWLPDGRMLVVSMRDPSRCGRTAGTGKGGPRAAST